MEQAMAALEAELQNCNCTSKKKLQTLLSNLKDTLPHTPNPVREFNGKPDFILVALAAKNQKPFKITAKGPPTADFSLHFPHYPDLNYHLTKAIIPLNNLSIFSLALQAAIEITDGLPFNLVIVISNNKTFIKKIDTLQANPSVPSINSPVQDPNWESLKISLISPQPSIIIKLPSNREEKSAVKEALKVLVCTYHLNFTQVQHWTYHQKQTYNTYLSFSFSLYNETIYHP